MKIPPWLIFLLIVCSPAHTAERKLKIGMLLWRGETRAEVGFKDRLNALGYTVDYVVFNSQQDLKKLGGHLHSIKKDIDTYDYIYTFGTTVSRRAKVVISGQTPQVFNIVTDPVNAGIVDCLSSPGKNISGASDVIGIAKQLGGVLRLFGFKKLGFFFNPREKNSMIIRNELLQFSEKEGFKVVDFRSPPVQNALARNLQILLDNPNFVDAVYLSADSYLTSEAELIGMQLRKAKVKSIASVRSLIEHGVLMGMVGDYYQLGEAVAGIVDRHQSGEELGSIPVEGIKTGTLMINRTTADLLRIRIDRSIDEETIFVE